MNDPANEAELEPVPCPACGYDLAATLYAGLTTCPECGIDLSRHVWTDPTGTHPPRLIRADETNPIGPLGYAIATLAPGVCFVLAERVASLVSHGLGVALGLLAAAGWLYCLLLLAERAKPLKARFGRRAGTYLAVLPCTVLAALCGLYWITSVL